MMHLITVPLELAEANEIVARLHRHHQPVVGYKFAIGCMTTDGSGILGVAIVGRPVARMNDDGWTLEVTRVATDGTANACSFLYGAAWRAARELGWKRLITYTLKTEPGTTLKAAGWRLIGERGGGSWNRENRPRVDKAPTGVKLLWQMQ
jgi:hypothetical protein